MVAEDQSMQPLIAVDKLADYINKLVELHLDYGSKSDGALIKKLEEKSTLDTLKQFVSDPQATSLMIERLSVKGLFN